MTDEELKAIEETSRRCASGHLNFETMAHARDDVPKLIAEVKRLRSATTPPPSPVNPNHPSREFRGWFERLSDRLYPLMPNPEARQQAIEHVIALERRCVAATSALEEKLALLKQAVEDSP